MNRLCTADRAREVLNYDQETGVFTWRIATGNRVKPGAVAGTNNGAGYLLIAIDRRRYKAHRLAFLYVHGRWPEPEVDHINGVRSDNRIANLREATRAQNCQNKKGAYRNSKSGQPGVYMKKASGKWFAEIVSNHRTISLGTFQTRDEAIAAYEGAKRIYHPAAFQEKAA